MKKGTENVPEGDEAAVPDQEPGVEVHAVAAVQSSKDGASSEVNRSKEVPKKTQGKNTADNGDAASKVKKAKQPAPGAQETEKGQGFKSFFDVFKSSSGTGTPADVKKAEDGHTKKPAHKQGRDDNEGKHDFRKILFKPDIPFNRACCVFAYSRTEERIDVERDKRRQGYR